MRGLTAPASWREGLHVGDGAFLVVAFPQHLNTCSYWVHVGMMPNNTGALQCPHCHNDTTVEMKSATDSRRTQHMCNHCDESFEIVGDMSSSVWRREPHPLDT